MMQGMRQIASAGAVAVLLLTAGCGPKAGHDEPTNPTAPVPSSSPSHQPSPAGSDGKAITFGKRGVTVQTAADAAKLTGTSDEFKSFVVDLATHLERPSGASDCFIGITVDAYDPSGFARGAVNDCGGYVALWGRQDGAWKELIGTQDAWSCAELKKFRVPSSLVDTCVGGGQGARMKQVPYSG